MYTRSRTNKSSMSAHAGDAKSGHGLNHVAWFSSDLRHNNFRVCGLVSIPSRPRASATRFSARHVLRPATDNTKSETRSNVFFELRAALCAGSSRSDWPTPA